MVYYPAAIGFAEALNKNIDELVKKFVSKNQRDWDEKTRWMPLGILRNGENPNKGYAIFLGIWMRCCIFTEDSNSISTYYSNDRDDDKDDERG